ncbi:MAG TPA: hypothetical protein VGF30_05390 [Bacteroidia bacterium]
MKLLRYILFVASILIISCNDIPAEATDVNYPSSFELTPGIKDTVNIIDHKGNKQGHWIITRTVTNDTTDKTELLWVEDGFYIDNKKEGCWRKYDEKGKWKDSVNFKNGIVVQL